MRTFSAFALILLLRTNVLAQLCDHHLSFSGSHSYVDCGPGSNFQVEGQLTVEAWVKLDSIAYPQYIAGNLDNVVSAGFELAVQNRSLCCTIRDTAVGTRSFTVPGLTFNVWTHLAFTYKVGGRFIGYINGRVVINMSASNARIGDNGSSHFIIGAAPWNGDTLNVHGAIDEVRVYNVERTLSLIREDMRMLLTGPQPGLVGYWRMSEGSGSFTADLSGNGHHGTLSGSNPPGWMPEEGPYGYGNSALRVCASSGPLSFPATWLDLEFPLTSLDTFVVSRIDCTPNVLPSGSAVYSDVYWVVDRYGVSMIPQFDFVFSLPAGSVGSADEISPSNLQLYRRDGFSTGAWNSSVTAASASVQQSTILFSNPQTTGQVMIGTTGNSILDISERPFDPTFFVWPNPADDRIMLQLKHPVSAHASFDIIDLRGRVVLHSFQVDSEMQIIPLSEIESGMYRIRRTDQEFPEDAALLIMHR